MVILIVSENDCIQKLLEIVPDLSEFEIKTVGDISDVESNEKFLALILDGCEGDFSKNVDASVVTIGKSGDLPKPFRAVELIELLKQKISLSSFEISEYSFFPSNRSIADSKNETLLAFTEKESELMEYLIKKGEVGVDNTEILKEIWGYEEGVETSTVSSHLYRINQKLSSVGIDKDYFLSINKKYFFKKN